MLIHIGKFMKKLLVFLATFARGAGRQFRLKKMSHVKHAFLFQPCLGCHNWRCFRYSCSITVEPNRHRWLLLSYFLVSTDGWHVCCLLLIRLPFIFVLHMSLFLCLCLHEKCNLHQFVNILHSKICIRLSFSDQYRNYIMCLHLWFILMHRFLMRELLASSW